MVYDRHEAGLKTYNKGIGIHGRTAEQHSEDSRKGGLVGGCGSALARGHIPWPDDEKLYSYKLSLKPKYHSQYKKRRGSRIKCQLIADELNKKWGNGRTAGAVSSQLYHHKKSLENIAEIAEEINEEEVIEITEEAYEVGIEITELIKKKLNG